MFLTSPDFFTTEPTYIPNAVPGDYGIDRNEDLLRMIKKYEVEMLMKVLGPSQYDYYRKVASFVVLDWWGWTRIVGKERQLLTSKDGRFLVHPSTKEEHGRYSYDNGTITIPFEAWNELIFGNGSYFAGLQELARYYVYCSWLVDFEITKYGGGSGKAVSSDLTQGVNNRSYVDRWNDMVELFRNLQKFMNESQYFNEFWVNRMDFEYKNTFGL